MRAVRVEQLREGDVLARPIVLQAGTVLLREGKKLTEQMINRLNMLEIKNVYIESTQIPRTMEITKSFLRSPEPLTQQVRKNVYMRLIRLPDSQQAEGRVAARAIEERFQRTFRTVMHDIASSQTVLDHLVALCQTDLYLFEHALNVALLSAILGLAQKYDYDQLVELTIGALLFDIGMIRLPRELLMSNRSFTKEERKLMEKHTYEGYQFLRSSSDIPHNSALCALLHHERYDGSGYPYQLKQNDIHSYGQIVAIADMYAAMTTPRYYRRAYTPGEAAEFFYAAGNQAFELSLIKLFFRHINVYPVSSVVRLSNGKTGFISTVDEDLAHRPTVKIVREADGSTVGTPYEIDLKQNMDIVIVNVW
ncbi:MAG: HD-GYP domain-containing protein [Clostridia bacterium]